MIQIDQKDANAQLRRFQDNLRKYAELSQKSMSDVLLKKGADFSIALGRRLKGFAPPKGSIRQNIKDNITRWGGIKIRDSIKNRVSNRLVNQGWVMESWLPTKQTIAKKYGKTGKELKAISVRMLEVEAEIRARERARGFLAISAFGRGVSKLGPGSRLAKSTSKGLKLSLATLSRVAPDQSLTFEWGPSVSQSSGELGGVMNRGDVQGAVAMAMGEVSKDMEEYIRDKQVAAMKRFFSSSVR